MDLYHVLNRGVEKRDLFMEETDYVRFVHNLYEFNDSAPANHNSGYHMQYRDLRSPYIHREREKLVEIHGWCLMKNHYHLLLSEVVEGGITAFLRKLNIGYAKYFNEKYDRSGTLFQGRTKKVLLTSQSQFLYILHYIHFNPLDYLDGAHQWRIRDKASIQNAHQALDYLDSYRWSSYLDYIGAENFPSLLTTSVFRDTRESGTYRDDALSFLTDNEFTAPESLALE